MKVLLLILVNLSVVLSASAQDKTVTIWTKGVPPGGIAEKAKFGNHILSISHRDKSGRVEVHQDKADVLVIQSGTATFVCGGEVADPVRTAPGEMQGSSIRGGTGRTVAPGDVIEVPAGLPHQFLLAPGAHITYLVVKVLDAH